MEIKKLIFNIKRKIMEYESKMNFYKKTELEYLEKIPSIYDYMVSLNDYRFNSRVSYFCHMAEKH